MIMFTPPPTRKIKVTICNHQIDSPLYVWLDLVICKVRKSMITHDTECLYGDQVSSNRTEMCDLKITTNVSSHRRDGWMDERCFRPLLCTVKAELGRGQPGLMSLIEGKSKTKIPLMPNYPMLKI